MVTRSFGKRAGVVLLLVMVLLAGACKKPPPVPAPPAAPPPQPPAPAHPTVTLQAAQTFLQRGESTTLSWSSTNATELTLSPGVGRVAPEGSTRVSPAESTTYTITATGPGGSQDATVRITVSAPPPPPPPPKPAATIEEQFRANVQDAFFDFDRADVRPDAREALARTAEFFRTHPDIRVTIEGHCDERGSTEYNLTLGARRAEAAKRFLENLGVSSERLEPISWGKERPFCTESNEECWQKNRRAHFVMAR